MVKLTLRIVVVFAIYLATTFLLYAGRIHGNPCCETDTVVFFIPILVSLIVYWIIVSSFQKSIGRKFGSPFFWATILTIISEIVSMLIKFGTYGT